RQGRQGDARLRPRVAEVDLLKGPERPPSRVLVHHARVHRRRWHPAAAVRDELPRRVADHRLPRTVAPPTALEATHHLPPLASSQRPTGLGTAVSSRRAGATAAANTSSMPVAGKSAKPSSRSVTPAPSYARAAFSTAVPSPARAAARRGRGRSIPRA